MPENDISQITLSENIVKDTEAQYTHTSINKDKWQWGPAWSAANETVEEVSVFIAWEDAGLEDHVMEWGIGYCSFIWKR